MPLPIVAIVGRPNVGKSTLFNQLLGRRISIVEPTAGVTRDRVSRDLELDGGRRVELVDTGGIGVVDEDALGQHIEQQIQVALEHADVIVFVVDVRDGVTPLDRHVAGRLRRLERPVILVANKVDEAHLEPGAGEFFALGLGEPLCLSAVQGFGRTELSERIATGLPSEEDLLSEAEAREARREDEELKIAIVGKRNVGKSTFVNALAREDRVIASEHAGTTRDAVDVHIERDGVAVTVIDTAGMRKKRKVESAIEVFGQARTERSIERADVVLLLFDVSGPLSQVDKQLAQRIEELKKPCVIVANKWDLARADHDTTDFHEYVQQELPGLGFCPMVFTAALEHKGCWNAIEVARELVTQAQTRVPTGQLNRIVEQALKEVRPRFRRGTLPKVYFVTQEGTTPPRFIFMVNKPGLFDDAYRRYLAGRIREGCGFEEVPIDLIFRERKTQYINEERAERTRHKKGRARVVARRARRARRSAEGGGADEGL